jgi:transposase
MRQQPCYVGLDVSLEQTSICVLNDAGAVVWRGKCASAPDSIAAILRKHAPGAVRVGLETGLLSTWLFHELKKQDLPVICIDARHAKAALSLRVNKTDTNDAHGISQIVRVGWYREVVVKSMDNHALRAMLSARAHLVAQSVTLANSIRGLLKVFGLVIRRAKGGRFDDLVRAAIADQPAMVVAIIEPLLAVLMATREQLAGYERIVRRRARADQVARRLMTVPGVGTVVALAFVSTIEDPDRFKRSSSVGAYLGLTPRRYQSGDVDRAGRISRCGDGMMRSYLFEAANVLLRRSARPCRLHSWGRALIERIGGRKAVVAVARKLAVLLHGMWRDGSEFRFGDVVTVK